MVRVLLGSSRPIFFRVATELYTSPSAISLQKERDRSALIPENTEEQTPLTVNLGGDWGSCGDRVPPTSNSDVRLGFELTAVI